MKTGQYKPALQLVRPQYSWEREDLIELSRRAIRAQCPEAYGEADIDVLTDPQNQHFILRTPVHGFVYEKEGKILGLSGWEREKQEGHARITHCFVDAEAMGEGVGSILLQHCLSHVRSCGYNDIALRATKNAETFYHRHGFVSVDTHKLPLDGTRFLKGVVMRAPSGVQYDSPLDLLVIESACDADGPGIIKLIGACFEEYDGIVLDVENEEPILKCFQSGFAELGGMSWVAKLNEQVVACIGFAPSAVGVELKKLYVDRELRGTGLAHHMMNLVLDSALACRVRAVDLWSDVKFKRAHAFYEKNGFKRTQEMRALHDLSNTVEYRFQRSIL